MEHFYVSVIDQAIKEKQSTLQSVSFRMSNDLVRNCILLESNRPVKALINLGRTAVLIDARAAINRVMRLPSTQTSFVRIDAKHWVKHRNDTLDRLRVRISFSSFAASYPVIADSRACYLPDPNNAASLQHRQFIQGLIKVLIV